MVVRLRSHPGRTESRRIPEAGLQDDGVDPVTPSMICRDVYGQTFFQGIRGVGSSMKTGDKENPWAYLSFYRSFRSHYIKQYGESTSTQSVYENG